MLLITENVFFMNIHEYTIDIVLVLDLLEVLKNA